MKFRLVLCLVVSLGLHAALFSLPWQILAPEGRQGADLYSVGLSSKELPPLPDEEPEPPRDEEDSLSFDVEGQVSPDYLYRLKARIFAVWGDYPAAAIARGSQGTVSIVFVVDPAGGLGQLAIVTSSGDRDLDECARRAVEDASPFDPREASLGAGELRITGHFRYILD